MRKRAVESSEPDPSVFDSRALPFSAPSNDGEIAADSGGSPVSNVVALVPGAPAVPIPTACRFCDGAMPAGRFVYCSEHCKKKWRNRGWCPDLNFAIPARRDVRTVAAWRS